jgi:hypothetical protein
MAGGHGWGGASQRVFQPPCAGLAPALPLLISEGSFLHTLMTPRIAEIVLFKERLRAGQIPAGALVIRKPKPQWDLCRLPGGPGKRHQEYH